MIDILSLMFSSKKKYNLTHQNKHERFSKLRHPLVYHPRYNITACGIEKVHPFDSCKYGRVLQYIKNFGVIENESQLHKPDMISRATLSTV